MNLNFFSYLNVFDVRKRNSNADDGSGVVVRKVEALRDLASANCNEECTIDTIVVDRRAVRCHFDHLVRWKNYLSQFGGKNYSHTFMGYFSGVRTWLFSKHDFKKECQNLESFKIFSPDSVSPKRLSKVGLVRLVRVSDKKIRCLRVWWKEVGTLKEFIICQICTIH